MRIFLISAALLVSSVALAGVLGMEKVTCNITATQLPSNSVISFSVSIPDGGDDVYFGNAVTLTTANGIARNAGEGFNDIRTGNTNHLWCRTTGAAAGQVIDLEWERY